ncbi:MAG: hypothetical protein PHS41_08655 [Victivallaceae bacterium]|nr:hypothetical protein [Victivallaceae bacterium]
MALSKNRKTNEREAVHRQFEAAATIYAGALVAINSDGKAVPASDASGLTVAGVACNQVASGGMVTVKSGCFHFKNSASAAAVTAAKAGDVCYVADDEKVSATGGTNSVVAGVVYDVDSNGVWVITGFPGNYAAKTHTHDGVYQPKITAASAIADTESDTTVNAILAALRAAGIIAG